MTFDSLLAAANPRQLWLEISPDDQSQAWQRQDFTPSSRWNAYLNHITLNTFISWLQIEYAPPAKVFPNRAALASIWEFVNGVAIVWGTTKIVLIPSETIDTDELRVPQEWIDIPEWTADYYLGVQVNSDDGWIRVWGYTTHLQLKTRGYYDASDRTYSLDEDELITDINVLWVAQQLGVREETRSAISPLAIPQPQAENLIQRLGNPEIITPRLEIPFTLWGAILAHGGWRQRLYERRQGLPDQWSILQWLRSGISDVAQQIGWQQVELQPSFARSRSLELTPSSAVLSRQLVIAGQQYELRIIQHPEQQWRFELRNTSAGALIPGGFKLRLLTEDLQGFDNNEDIATAAVEQLFVEVTLEPGEGIVWEIEPTPENYEREILRF
ncbi:DUF1822 family protein [Gloeocapsopsis dulcis]|uniref:DUF1822 domain-containing protein n=1 Tax=Gloeocapsopsis dulcis AAB1 = 1H9 TaxID=1433147 RepID=A0A6N8G2K7_9CHRO|nr:DUF1822 family protein [Gloeocapsopsis dulcis]MUL38406.1 hypothetical protein [Gloeocapsopsis dulcis AAB1 = 1H9]WNN89192.1 DUF1822 family protein [Gloeocapsopsis dulcis]